MLNEFQLGFDFKESIKQKNTGLVQGSKAELADIRNGQPLTGIFSWQNWQH